MTLECSKGQTLGTGLNPIECLEFPVRNRLLGVFDGPKAIRKAPDLAVQEAQKRVITKLLKEDLAKSLETRGLAAIAVEGYQTEY
jgi:hypothetical protein